MSLNESLRPPSGRNDKSATPSIENINFALSEAQQNTKKPVELRWKEPSGVSYTLKVVSAQGTDPKWTLYAGDASSSTTVWTHPSLNVEYIHGLIVTACANNVPAPADENRFAGASAVKKAARKEGASASAALFASPVPEANNAPSAWPETALSAPQWTKIDTTAPTSTTTTKEPAKETVSPIGLAITPAASPITKILEAPAAKPSMPAIGLPWFPSTNAAPGPNSGSVPNIQIPASADVPTTNVLTAEAPPAVLPKSEDKLPPPVELDPATMETVFKAVSVEGVGLLSYPAFQFFLVREFMRFRQSSSPFAVAIFQLSVNYGREEGLKPISSRAIREAARRAFSVMQPLDLLAQYQTSDFAFLLPGLNKADAKKFVQKFHETIFASPLLSSVDPQTLLMYAGIAAIPEDCIHPGILLAAAEKAKTKAHELNVPVMLFAD